MEEATLTNAKRHFDSQLYALRRDARIIRTLNANDLTVEKWNPIQDILTRTVQLETPQAAVHPLVGRDDALWHNLNAVIRAKANLTLLTPDPAVNDQLERSISQLQHVFDAEFSEASEASDNTE